MYPVSDKKQQVYLRAEAVRAVVDLMSDDDPLELFDRVMLIHRTRYEE